MAGHSHWAGIKHKKGKADKIRSKIFSKLSREITVAAKLGDKNPDINSRLRSAIQSARSANMPKNNIIRAIQKSEQIQSTNYEQIRYEGFDLNGNVINRKAEGLHARVVQHEYDHLNLIMYINRLADSRAF